MTLALCTGVEPGGKPEEETKGRGYSAFRRQSATPIGLLCKDIQVKSSRLLGAQVRESPLLTRHLRCRLQTHLSTLHLTDSATQGI